MKKIFALAVAVVMIVAVLCTPVSALDLDQKNLMSQVWAQDTTTWSWISAGTDQIVDLGETKTITFTDGKMWAGLDTSNSINMGLQVLDQTLTANGEHSQVKYELSDLVIKANGYDDLVVKVAGTYDQTHDTVRPTWTDDDSVVGNNSEDYSFSPADIGITATADYIAWFNAIESMTVTVTYIAYNGEGADTAAEPEATEPEATEPEATEPEATEPEATEPEVNEAPAPAPAPAPSAPATGLALAVVPAVMALAAVAVSKKR